jgi:hypothetical protein
LKFYPELEFLKSPWRLGTAEEEVYRTGQPGYIGWRNAFLRIDSGAPYKFKNTGSGCSEPYRTEVIERICQTLGYSSPEEVIRVLGYLDVNSIAVRGASQLLFDFYYECSGFGSTSVSASVRLYVFGPTGSASGPVIYMYGSGSGSGSGSRSFYQQEKKLRKTLIFTVYCLPLVTGTDPRIRIYIRIHTKMTRYRTLVLTFHAKY